MEKTYHETFREVVLENPEWTIEEIEKECYRRHNCEKSKFPY